MRTLIIKILIFVTSILLVESFIFYTCRLPMPIMSNSISLDAKIHDFQQHKFDYIELLSVGSSITLDDVNSDVVVKNLTTSYYNLGAWGLQISDIHNLLKYYSKKINPRYVIICSSVTDFCHKENIKLPSYTELYINENFDKYFYYKKQSFKLLIHREDEFANYKKMKNGYQYLNFDQNGGISLNIPKENIKPERWNEKMKFPTKWTEYNYSELVSLVKDLNDKGIKLFFVQSPIKKALADDDSTRFANHFNKCKNIVESYNGIYLNYHNCNIFSDKLFVDQYHLSEEGSIVMTQLLVKDIKPFVQKQAYTNTAKSNK